MYLHVSFGLKVYGNHMWCPRQVFYTPSTSRSLLDGEVHPAKSAMDMDPLLFIWLYKSWHQVATDISEDDNETDEGTRNRAMCVCEQVFVSASLQTTASKKPVKGNQTNHS